MTTTVTFSLSSPDAERQTITDTAIAAYHAVRDMSTQTKQRLEMMALILGLVLTVVSAVKVFVLLPPRVDALERNAEEHTRKIEAMQTKATATDIAIARIEPQLAAINAGIAELKADVRQIRDKK